MHQLKFFRLKTTVNTWVQGLCGAPDVPSIVHANSAELVSPKDRQKGRRVKSSSLGEEEEEDCCSSFAIANADQENGQISRSVFQTGLGVVVIMPSVPELLIRSANEPVNFVFSYKWPCGNASATTVTWTLCLVESRIFFKVPPGLSVERSKEAFVTLLELAEEEMDCTQIVVSFGKDRPEKRKSFLY